MPGYRTHLFVGAVLYVGMVATSQYLDIALLDPVIKYTIPLLFMLIGSIFPDIDIASKMQQLFFLCLAIAAPVFLYCGYPKVFLAMAAVMIFILCIKHRTITHNPTALALLSLCLVFFAHAYLPDYDRLHLWCASSFFIGACSHVLLDLGPKRFFGKR